MAIEESFMKALFHGVIAEDMVLPWPEAGKDEREHTALLLEGLRSFGARTIDAARIDREGAIPEEVLQGLRERGVFGLNIPQEYGGRGRLHLFRPPASEPEHTFEDFRGEFYEYTRKAAISPDARWLAYPGPNQTVKLVDLKSRTLRFTLTGMSSDVTALAFSKDGDRLAATGGDGTLIVWSLDSGTPVLGPFLAHAAAVTHVEFSDDGKTVLTTASAGGLRLWNAANGRSMISIPEAESTPAPLLAEGDRALVFWNLKTGDLERHPAPPLPSMTPSKR